MFGNAKRAESSSERTARTNVDQATTSQRIAFWAS